MSDNALIVGVGDIHGRFHRVRAWLETLERALERPADAVLAVGDVEAFATADDHRRKAAKRTMPAEFAAFARGEARMTRPFYFIGCNNEDFESLHDLSHGGEVSPGVRYLGRVGTASIAGLRVGWLSGIYAPKWLDTPLQSPTTAATRKQAGYFRRDEVDRLRGERQLDLLLTHEWPRGLFARTPGKPVRPWMGNPLTRELVDEIQPSWLLCGHSHERFAATLHHDGGTQTRVACLDEAAEPDGSVLWMEWSQGQVIRAGWGIDGHVFWAPSQAWGASRGASVRHVP